MTRHSGGAVGGQRVLAAVALALLVAACSGAQPTGDGTGPRRASRDALPAASAGPNGGRRTPSSVTIPVISSAGVTSKAGFQTAVPTGAIRVPRTSVTSRAARSSTVMAPPSGVSRSTDEIGAQT